MSLMDNIRRYREKKESKEDYLVNLAGKIKDLENSRPSYVKIALQILAKARSEISEKAVSEMLQYFEKKKTDKLKIEDIILKLPEEKKFKVGDKVIVDKIKQTQNPDYQKQRDENYPKGSEGVIVAFGTMGRDEQAVFVKFPKIGGWRALSTYLHFHGEDSPYYLRDELKLIEDTEEKIYSDFLEDLVKYTVELEKDTRVRLRKESLYFHKHKGKTGTILRLLSGEFFAKVRWDDEPTKFSQYYEKDLEPAEIPEENKRKIEEIRKEIELRYKLNSYDEIVAGTIKEGVEQMQAYGMSQQEINSFFEKNFSENKYVKDLVKGMKHVING